MRAPEDPRPLVWSLPLPSGTLTVSLAHRGDLRAKDADAVDAFLPVVMRMVRLFADPPPREPDYFI